MHSPSQSLWSSDGEEVHSVTLDFSLYWNKNHYCSLVLWARYQRGGPGAQCAPAFVASIHTQNFKPLVCHK